MTLHVVKKWRYIKSIDVNTENYRSTDRNRYNAKAKINR